ncbi:hypothetical protein [Nostoc sp. DSM 114159]|jgi:hypothetical protein
MSLLDDLVETYFNKDLATVSTQVGIESIKITEINRQILKKLSLLNSY